jgi:hypothetical protein
MGACVNFVAIPAADAQRLHAAAHAGDAEAKAFFAGLFPEGGACFLCDATTPLGATGARWELRIGVKDGKSPPEVLEAAKRVLRR